MENTPLTRAYLETLSTKDLVDLADTNGIDIPEGLNRRFIIGELLDIAADEDLVSADLVDAEFSGSVESLPDTYNETQISVLVRDPGWAFVYWDFQASLLSAITANHRFETFFLRVYSLSTSNPPTVIDYYDVSVGVHDRKWYVHLTGRDEACLIDLFYRNLQEKEQLLARSRQFAIPVCGMGEQTFGVKRRNPPLVELSGIEELRKIHFKNHRQSFT